MTLGCVGHWSVAHLRDCWSIWDAWAPVRLIRPQPSTSHCFPIAALHFAQSKTQLLWEVYTSILWATAPELIVHDFLHIIGETLYCRGSLTIRMIFFR